MGGGDLNLKKSWHPHTLKNQEKVWKAEQKKTQEERKVGELRKEIQEEKNREELKRIGEASGVLAKSDGDKKLEWMYKNSNELINREEYLLGRTVDKSFEILQAEEQRKDQHLVGVKEPLNHVEHECIPFSMRSYLNNASTEQVDLQRKVMEDPLMLIKQREMESRRKLLENPVKLKELHRILKTDQMLKRTTTKQCKSSKKSKKSKKKHKKPKTKSDSESDSQSAKDLDKELAKRYRKLKDTLIDKEENLSGFNIAKLLDAKYETISKELDKAVETKRKPKKSERRQSSSDEREWNKERPSKAQRRKDFSPDEKKETSRRRDVRNRRRSRSRSPNIRHQTYKNVQYSRNERKRSPGDKAKPSTSKGTKLTEAEKEARCREMMENASWREAERTQVVQKHRTAYAQEEESNRKRDFDRNFINTEVKKAIASQTSVGSRLRANLNNIQRTASAMESNFSKK